MGFFKKKREEPMLPPEWLVVGLGNPGPEYAGTRHNVGFEVIDKLAAKFKSKLGTRQHRAVYGQAMIGDASVLLVKPLTFMNISGQAVAPIARSFGIKPDHILVIADDLDLPPGKLRIRASGSAGGHNGHKSLIALLGTEDYPRIKIGIGKAEEETIDHVLSKFNPRERALIDEQIDQVVKAVEVLINQGIEPAMSTFN